MTDFRKFVEDFSRWSTACGGKDGQTHLAGKHVAGPTNGSSVVCVPQMRDPLPVMREMLARIEELTSDLEEAQIEIDRFRAWWDRGVDPETPAAGPGKKNLITGGGLELD